MTVVLIGPAFNIHAIYMSYAIGINLLCISFTKLFTIETALPKQTCSERRGAHLSAGVYTKDVSMSLGPYFKCKKSCVNWQR